MSQKLLPISPLQLLFLQCLLIGFTAAYPYLIFPASPSSGDSRRLVKRAFDRFDNSGVFSFGAKRFDRYDDETAYGYGFDNHIFKRSADPYRFMSVPTKKAFDRMDNSDFFGAKRKRSFDRMGGTEFGLMKRSAPESREQLINNLAESIITLRRAREAESSPESQRTIITYDD
ncbi:SFDRMGGTEFGLM [Caenorhabditis elegans]|uniref:Neuropeptide-like protein nlp-8 n=1 Tax=Caenorhabditis elegans TaxID=6239 RepID=NLP8_CAEEL|nr:SFDRMGGTEFGLM [Caenorhabditis elegans]Q93409.1 RecName: Full=Neuropeptide-like protein nlp-8; Contains: RecName: Full=AFDRMDNSDFFGA; Contains: RecName: Full=SFDRMGGTEFGLM; Flags: Precursor [Caenorhabditis elegans]CAB02079.1 SFDRMGGTEFGLM [Caenorhabditis elegans]|eukprot:NP_492158.1 Neuropeptide-Like Protein [Caenorhabditis elegans]